MPRPSPLPTELSLELGLDAADDPAALRALVAGRLRVPEPELPEVVVRQRSLDARHGRARFRLLVAFEGEGPARALGAPDPVAVGAPRAIVVGAGPAGLFCAYELARRGVGAIVLDRGKLVQPRRHDLKALNRRGLVDADSNYCFGEGGAGTYSDGKLYTRSHKRGNVRDVIEILARHGAPEAILTEARPHIGSNRLPKVVTALRERLQAAGSEFRFGARVVDLLVEGQGSGRELRGVRLADGSELVAEAVALCAGHSARDVWELVERHGVALEPKPFAVGVRAEHPQPLVDRIQYGALAGHPRLPSATYRLAANVRERGVFSFCMCPGGWIVPASTAPGELVVNGMSLSRRDSPFANSGLVVAVELEDLARAGLSGSFAGVELQRRLERAAFEAGGGELRAPATRVGDFLRGRASSTLPDSSYIPGVVAGEVGAVLDAAGLDLSARLREALRVFGRSLPGYLSDDAILVAGETRTSAPVRVLRDAQSFEAPALPRLFPVGEGAGYAGGIVSAALDGMRAAQAMLRRLGVPA